MNANRTNVMMNCTDVVVGDVSSDVREKILQVASTMDFTKTFNLAFTFHAVVTVKVDRWHG